MTRMLAVGADGGMSRVRACFACDAVLFDMDGVLVDSMSQIERLLRNWAARHALDADSVVRLSHGRRDIDVVRLSAPHLDPVREAAWIQQTEVADAAGIHAFPGARQLLDSIPLTRWAIVTSGPRLVARARLEAARLPLPDVLITSDDVERGKPDPECYLRAARQLRVAPTYCLVVEDAPAGVAAARAAGMRVVGVGDDLKSNPSFVPDAWVEDVEKLSVVEGSRMLNVWAGIRPVGRGG